MLSKPLISDSNHMIYLLGVIQTIEQGLKHTANPVGVIQTIHFRLKPYGKSVRFYSNQRLGLKPSSPKFLYHSARQLTYRFRRAPHVLLWTPHTLDFYTQWQRFASCHWQFTASGFTSAIWWFESDKYGLNDTRVYGLSLEWVVWIKPFAGTQTIRLIRWCHSNHICLTQTIGRCDSNYPHQNFVSWC